MTDGERQGRRGRATGARHVHALPGDRGSPKQLSDLLPAVALGDRDAYEAVYDMTSGWVLAVALKVVRDPAQAEEVMQEVLLEVWRTASRFDPALGSGTAWVMTL